ncbi:hypothetical protein [uncultured Parasutterella sp.]|uniref:phage tail fiber protein n=1 Tax=uncultured Parasutterella sp. TaxID=1263098 RepID=UPI0025955154|nr:hypothetical protein [uncultured Parasutterella sp.]
MPTQNLDITAANASAVMTVEDLYPNGIKLERFSTDAAIVADSQQVAETRMGVDGKMAAGVTPNIYPVTVTLEANSPTATSFSTIYEAMNANKRLYVCNLTIKIPSIGRTYQFSNGVLQTANPMPALNKVLAPTTWVFHFESMERV